MKLKNLHAPLLCIIICISILLPLLTSCAPEVKARSTDDYFNTASVIYSYAGDSEEVFLSNFEFVKSRLEEYHRLYDIYYEYKDENYQTINNIKTINKNAGICAVKVDQKIIDLLLYSKELCYLTGGKMNVASGAMLALWHNERENALDNPTEPDKWKLPDEDALREAAKHANIDNLIIDEKNSTVYLSDPDMRLDVGAVAKGYATERIAEELEAMGVDNYVLNIGGNIRMIGGLYSGEAHTIHIRNPKEPYSTNYSVSISAKDISCVTSGNYERYYYVGQERYHHIIDPDTLYPASLFDAVTILTKDSGLADALSTALFCISEKDGRELLSSLDCEVDVIWIYPNGQISMTDGIVVKNSR